MTSKDVATWPLFLCVEPDVTARLIQFQYENYGTKLDIMTEPVEHPFELESLEEIDLIIRERRPAPRRSL